MRIHAAGHVRSVVDRRTVLRRVVHVAQRAGALEDLGADLPVVGAARVVLGGLTGHVGEGFVHAAALAAVVVAKAGLLLGEAVRDLVRADVQADQRIERAGAVAERHRGAVPEGVFVVGLVVDLHHQLEAQRCLADVGLVHVEDDLAEVMRIVQRRIGAIDGLHRVARAGVGERGVAGVGAGVVEVDRLHVGAVHRAGGAALRDVQVTVVGAVLVLAGLGVAAGAGADQRMLEVLALLEDATGVGIDDDQRTGRAARADGVGEEGHHVGQVATAGFVDVDPQVGRFVLDQHPGDAVAQAGALAGDQCGRLAQARRGRGDVLVQAGVQVAEHGAHVAGAVLADHHAFAEDRDATEGLVIAVVAHAVVGALGAHQQGAVPIGAHELRVAGVGHLGHAAGGDLGLVLLLELGDVALVQVDLARRLCAGRDEGQRDGCGEHVDSAETIHWHYP